MLNTLPFSILIGAVLGFLAGLGTGGGSLLLLWLTFLAGVEQETARTINLLFFITSAGSVSLLRLRSGKIEYKKILPGILTGCAAAAAISIFGRRIDPTLLKKAFGVLLLFTGARELLYRPRNER